MVRTSRRIGGSTTASEMSATTACTLLLRRSAVADLAPRYATMTSPVPECEKRPPAGLLDLDGERPDGLPASPAPRGIAASGSVASTAASPAERRRHVQQAASPLACGRGKQCQPAVDRAARRREYPIRWSYGRSCEGGHRPPSHDINRRRVLTARHVPPAVSGPVSPVFHLSISGAVYGCGVRLRRTVRRQARH